MIILIFLLPWFQPSTSYGNPDEYSVPHREELENILSRAFENTTDLDGSVFQYLFGGNSDPSPQGNIDITYLTLGSIRKIINVLENKYAESGRRQWANNAIYNAIMIPRIIKLMHQTIYATRFRLRDSNPFRNKYRNDPSYKIAVLIGMVDQIMLKMDNLFGEMCSFQKRTHFLWFLIIYEKMLSMHVDVGYLVRQVMRYQSQWLASILKEDGGKSKSSESIEEG